MSDEKQEAIASAEAYETLHVPALFREWTARVLDAADTSAGHRVLDVACGTGVLARDALHRVGPTGAVVGVDPNPGMLAVAEALAPEVDWRSGVAEDLPVEDSSFDRVVSQFGMMFFENRPKALGEIERALVPGGRFAVAVWDALENQPAYSVEVDLLERMAGREAADALRAPFVLGDPSELSALARDAGMTAEVETIVGGADFPSIRSMVEADLRGWLPVMGVHLDEDLIEGILSEAEDDLRDFVGPDGRMRFDSPAHILSGTVA